MPEHEDADDQSLVDAVVTEHSEAAFRHLYRRHSGALFGLALRLSGGRHALAEDAVQNTWLRAVERFALFRWESALRTWLSAILINCCRERLRAEVTLDGLTASAVVATTTGPDVGALRVDLERALASLPDGYREVLVLHDVEGYTHKEIASLLGVEPGTSKSQLSHARRAMRMHLASLHAHATPD